MQGVAEPGRQLVKQSSWSRPRTVFGDRLVFTGFILLLVLVVFGPLMSNNNQLNGEGNPYRQAGYLVAALLVLAGLRPWARFRSVLTIPTPMALTLLICLVSLTWSLAPGIGLRRLALTAVVMWVICSAIDRLSYRQMLSVIRIALALTLIANYLTVFAAPDIGIHSIGDRVEEGLIGDWRGLVAHKNFAGAICAITVLFFLFDARGVPRLVRFPVIAGALVFLLMSQSKTSVGMLFGGVAVGYLFSFADFRYRIFSVLIATVGTVGLMAYLSIYRYAFAQLITDPETFTGRLVIWVHLGAYIKDHFWLGTGYGSFWNIGPDSPIYHYANDWVTDLTAGHNGYLDLAAQVGVPLAVVIVVLMLLWPFVRLLAAPRSAGQTGALLVGLMLFGIGHNMTETSLLERDTMMQVAIVIAVALTWKVVGPAATGGRLLPIDPIATDGTRRRR